MLLEPELDAAAVPREAVPPPSNARSPIQFKLLKPDTIYCTCAWFTCDWHMHRLLPTGKCPTRTHTHPPSRAMGCPIVADFRAMRDAASPALRRRFTLYALFLITVFVGMVCGSVIFGQWCQRRIPTIPVVATVTCTFGTAFMARTPRDCFFTGDSDMPMTESLLVDGFESEDGSECSTWKGFSGCGFATIAAFMCVACLALCLTSGWKRGLEDDFKRAMDAFTLAHDREFARTGLGTGYANVDLTSETDALGADNEMTGLTDAQPDADKHD